MMDVAEDIIPFLSSGKGNTNARNENTLNENVSENIDRRILQSEGVGVSLI